jgi:hypothetical protein
MTGFYRNGYYNIREEDGGNYSIAGIFPPPIPSIPFPCLGLEKEDRFDIVVLMF